MHQNKSFVKGKIPIKKQLPIKYADICSLDNLLSAWQEFVRGKRAKKDVQAFAVGLMENLTELRQSLADFSFRHGPYEAFNISDPKPRSIHKAQVADRVLHHAVYRQIYPFFHKTFIADSFSCQQGKGVHKAVARFQEFGRKASLNNTKTVWVLKCDIKKFFASIDHEILLEILKDYIPDRQIMGLLGNVVASFNSGAPGKGLPLGNLTSQLFCNVYLNPLDQFAKHQLKQKYYIRYADDFVFMSRDKSELELLIPRLNKFLGERLKLGMHPDKIFIKTLASGVDFLGWTHFPHHRVLRTTTRRKMFRQIYRSPKNNTLQSYRGLLLHGNARKLEQELLNWYGLWEEKSQEKYANRLVLSSSKVINIS